MEIPRWPIATLKGSMYRELPKELDTQIEKVSPIAAQIEMEEMLQRILESDKSFLKLDHG